MWASDQRDGRPAKYIWRPLPESRAVTLYPLKLPGVPQTNETISAASGPKFTIL